MHGVTNKEFSTYNKYRPTSSFVESLYGDSGIVTSGSSNIIFKTSNYNERMRISSEGYVGIGVTPIAKLHVKGDDLINTSLAFSASGQTGSGLVVTNFNRVGIGTSTPAGALHVYGASAGASTSGIRLEAGNGKAFTIISGITGVSNNGLEFYDSTAAASRMVIDTNGYLGVGISSPSYKLDVVGTSALNSSLRLWHSSSNTVGNYNSIIMPVFNGTSGFELRHYGNSTDGYSTYFMGGQAGGSSLYFSGGTLTTSSKHFTVHSSGFIGVNTSNAQPSGQFQVNASSSATIGTVFKAASSQTADISQWLNSSNAIIAKIDSGGSAFFQNITSSAGISGSSATFSNITASSLTTGSILFVGNNGAISQSNGSLYWNYSNSMLGIRTSNPSHIVHISPVLTSQTTAIYGIVTDHDITQTGDVSTVAAGAFTLRQKGSVNQTNSGNGSSAIIGSAFSSNTGTVTMISGIRLDTRNLSTGTVTNAVGTLVNDIVNSGGGSIVNAYGVRIMAQTGGTSIYGIASEISASTNRFNIFASGSAQNYFAGSVGIGIATPTASLHVSSATPLYLNTTSAAQITLFSGGTLRSYLSGNSTDALSIANSSNTIFFRVSQGGNVGINTVTPSAQLQVNASSSATVCCILKEAATPTANVFEHRSSSDTLRTAISAGGYVGLGGVDPSTQNARVTINTGTSTGTGFSIDAHGTFSSDGSVLHKVSNLSSSSRAAFALGQTTNDSSTPFIIVRHGTIHATRPSYVDIKNTENAPVSIWTNNTEKLTVLGNGNVGIGNTSPTAVLHLKAGAAAASTAPLKFTSGSLLSTPESGSLEYNGDTFYMSNKDNVGGRSSIVGCIYTHTSSITIANTVNETSILQSPIVLPANFFSTGKNLSIKMCGFHSSTASPTVRLKVLFNSSSYLDTQAVSTANSTNGYYELTGEICCRTVGVSGSLYSTGFYKEKNNGGSTVDYCIVNTTTSSINTTVTQSLNITFAWSTANASNTCTTTNGYILIQN